ncbi:protein cordon-bleu isoform X2 [Brachyistius frenatus]|uniref:protein cordon-bleu isoform X2 n=1 Tax=Brachyistius frenatus TaxID=100188 RepID=UPI0037E8F704
MTESSKAPSGRRMKAHAPPLPQVPQPAPRHIFRNSVPDGGGGTSGMDAKENILRPTVDLQLTLPQGYQASVTEDGSKALMDLLVELCSRYHLNPALHSLELLSPEGHPLGFKPNALLGSLNVACVLIKEKVWEEKVVRRPAPKVPEKTVRLMVNYHGSQKAVVRVNPSVPLQVLLPVICDKCEFDPAHVLLLKNSISRHELPLDKSLSDLGIKELYVHDQSLVFQPKMSSAPVLNYSESIRSSTTSLGRPEKKGLLGIFQFSRRKSKGLSTVSGVPSVEDRPSTLGQSQSVMNILRMSPKADTKKRRAPVPPGAPTPSMGHTSFESYQMGLGSESQQRKRKAPAPPPTPTSITQGTDDTSTSDAPTPDSPPSETLTRTFRTKVAPSTTVSAPTVVIQTIKPAPIKTAVHPPPVCDTTPTPSSPTPSSGTTDSLAVQDSSSDLSHSLDDSDADFDPTGSHCSTLTSSSVSGSLRVQPVTTSTTSRKEESPRSVAAQSNQEVTSDSSSRSETESPLNLKLDEVENNRHSAMGSTDRPVPPKPRRSSAREPSHHVLPPPLSSPPIDPTDSNPPQNPMEVEEAAPQSWLHSMRTSAASGQKSETEAPEDETLSLGSSGSSSLPDQGYAASEGMVEGEDSGMVSSPSDTQPTSPDGSLSLDGSSRGRGEKLEPVQDSFSDSDEGCAIWGSKHRHTDISPQAQSVRLKSNNEEDAELTAQLHQTLADFEADLAGHMDIVLAKETPYTMSTDSNEVPVSMVDMDVPVTAIDEVLEDYEQNIVQHEVKSLTRIEPAGSKGQSFYHKSIVEPQNKNNNACTAAVSNKRSGATTKHLSQSEQHSEPPENKSVADNKGVKTLEAKVKEMSIADTNGVKGKQTSAVKSNVDVKKNSKNTEISLDTVKSTAQTFQQRKLDIPPTGQRSVSDAHEEMHRVYQNNSTLSNSHGKITRSVTSRFGMKTFTVVPPKPSVIHAAAGQSAATLTTGAIKIDDQGNMVTAGISRNKVGGSSESETTSNKASPLLGKAKAFWSSNEKEESAVTHSKDVIDKVKENTNGLKTSPTAFVETTLKAEYLKTTHSTLSKPAERVQPKEMVKEEAKEAVKDIKVANEQQVQVESKISVSKNVQQPSSKSALPPHILPDLKRDLSFLKPSRRTSSQYVASAISKHAPKTSAKPSFIPDYSASLKTQTTGFQRSGRSIQVNPHQSSVSSLSDNKENVSASTSNPPGPKRSMSFPEYVPDSPRDFGEVRQGGGGFENCVVSTKGSSDMLELETAKNNLTQSSGLTQIRVTANHDGDSIKPIRPRSPSPAKSSALPSSIKPPTAPKTMLQDQTSISKDTTKAAAQLTPGVKPQPSITVTDSGVTSGPPAVTVFGPIKKFRPVICRSVEKDTSLHSSLMAAIHTDGGRDRLKKTSTSGPSNLNREPYVEEENERSTLLAAIRAQNISSRLRKTKSEAADEVEKFRKVASEEKRSATSSSSPSPPSLTCTSPVSTPPPPPPAPALAPPPPPPVLPLGKPSSVAQAKVDAPTNAGLAREAMLEAIRSGSAAERLKKVALPTKTVQVNGRLGTIQATSSTIPQQ